MNLTYAPLGDRTPFVGDTTASPFTVSWKTVLDLLDRELYQLDATDVVLEVDVPASSIRLDGTLRADRRVESPGVRLRFECKHGGLSYATDRFYAAGRVNTRRSMDPLTGEWSLSKSASMRDSWRHNVYAIAKGLEALRMVDRYGIASHGEQYRGYAALGAGTGIASGMTASDAEQIINRAAGVDFDLGHVTDVTIKRARAATHPDRPDQDGTQYALVDQAAQVLRRAGKVHDTRQVGS